MQSTRSARVLLFAHRYPATAAEPLEGRNAPHDAPANRGSIAPRALRRQPFTYSHVNLATLPESQLHHEIVDSAAQIASWTGQPVDAFAWTFSWDSITPAAWKLIQQHHRFC